MNVLTKAQRQALKRVFDRQALVLVWNGKTNMPSRAANYDDASGRMPHTMTYRQFRKLAHVSFGCVMVPWCGMWLGIETDGYTHS